MATPHPHCPFGFHSRRCLKCRKKFRSWGPGNCPCDYCRGRVNAGMFENVDSRWSEELSEDEVEETENEE